ncbi:MAG: polynucleotide adenylyltransferase [Trizodia sp. TS-e1964]|nr:MAG: polynucleotide adenylyltransferase [Trizodia sp. TS-e1964]
MEAPQPGRQYGVTSYLSKALPTEAEIAVNNLLIDELKRQNNFESQEQTQKRKVVLESLQKITLEFVKQVSKVQGLPDSIAENSGGKIFTYGSYRLGVYGPGSDIDTLVVVPKHISREEFFQYFPPLLIKLAPPNSIQELTPVPDAFVPIIKFEYSGISIDLIFAQLAIRQVAPDLTLNNKDILRGVDEKCLRCLNGTRVTDEILELVPQKAVFRTALRGIKLWAQSEDRRAVYANVMGFPGGVAWAMLVARVCQLYPQATSSVIIAKFFRIIGRWPWPQPVLLKAIEGGPLQVRVWNPQIYHGDKYHIMPIITPAYPSMCATHNITSSTKTVLSREMERAAGIVDRIMVSKVSWKELFARHSFFTTGYKYYLSVIAASRNKESQLLWSGLVESKVRLLVSSLEHVHSIALAHPFNKGFDREHHCNSEDEFEKISNGDLQYQVKDATTEILAQTSVITPVTSTGDGGDTVKTTNEQASPEKNDKNHKIYTTTYYIGIELAADGKKQLDISYSTNEFKAICTGWQQYDIDTMSVNVVHTRNYDLPDDVFQPDETKPTRAGRAPKSKAKKRTHASIGQDSADPQNVVFGLARSIAKATVLSKLAGERNNVHIVEGDITNPQQMKEAAAAVSKTTGGSLDVLVNNAALFGGPTTGFTLTDFNGKEDLFKTDMNQAMEVNVYGIVYTTNAFLPLLLASSIKKIICITTALALSAFVEKTEIASIIPYSVSKAALNMVVTKYAILLKEQGVTVLGLSPGWVNTSDGEPTPEQAAGNEWMAGMFRKVDPRVTGQISVQESAKAGIKVIQTVGVEDSGKVLSHHGDQENWL